MTNTIKSIIAGIVVLVVGFILGSLSGYKASVPQVQPATLGSVQYDQANLAGGVRIGLTGSLVSNLITGTCNLVAVGTDAIAGGATKTATCAATNVKSGDQVTMRLPYKSGSTVIITGTSASTTAGYITVGLYNASTTVTSSVSAIGTSTQFHVTR